MPVDTADHALDLWVHPDGSWSRKDEDEFTAKVGRPLYWDAARAERIRAEGNRSGG